MKTKMLWAAASVLAAGALTACTGLNGLLGGLGSNSSLNGSVNLTSNNSNSLSSVSPLSMTLSNGSTYATQALTASPSTTPTSGAPTSPTLDDVYVTFSQVQVHYDGENTATGSLTPPATDSPDTDPGWLTFNASTSQQIDLEKLATDTAFGTMNSLKDGTYTQIRLAVQSAEVKYTNPDGSSATASLDVPSSELKIIKPFVLKPGYATTLHFDFATSQSVRQANGVWMINPTAIHTVPTYAVQPSPAPSASPSASPSA